MTDYWSWAGVAARYRPQLFSPTSCVYHLCPTTNTNNDANKSYPGYYNWQIIFLHGKKYTCTKKTGFKELLWALSYLEFVFYIQVSESTTNGSFCIDNLNLTETKPKVTFSVESCKIETDNS